MYNSLLAEVGLLGSPIVGFFLYRRFKLINKFFFWSFCVIALLALARLFNITFKGDLLDLLLPIGVYTLYCFIILHALLIRNIFLRIVTFIIGFIPIAGGYLFATIGVLGVFFVFGEQEPIRTVDINKKYYYREFGFGNATTSWGGTRIEIYESLFLLPFLEKRILQKDFDSRYYETDSLNVKLDGENDLYKVKIYSGNKLQLDTIMNK